MQSSIFAISLAWIPHLLLLIVQNPTFTQWSLSAFLIAR